MHPEAIIFDVHRTLVDDSGFPRKWIIQLMKETGVEVDPDEYYTLYNRWTRELFDWPSIRPFIPIREIHRRRLKQFYQHFRVDRDIETDLDFLWQKMGTGRIYPDAGEILDWLNNKYTVGLLSNADTDDPLIRVLLEAGYRFDVIITSGAEKVYKPAPEIFNRLINRLNIARQRILMVGDSPVSDIAGAKQAGLAIAWINRQGTALPDHYPKPDFELSSLIELIPILEAEMSHS